MTFIKLTAQNAESCANRYENIRDRLSNENEQLFGVLHRYETRAGHFNSTINLSLGEDAAKIVEAIADWMNQENDVSDLEALLDMELKEDDLTESLPVVTRIISQLVVQLNNSEPEVDQLVDLTILTLLFFRTYLICHLSEEDEEQFVEILNDFCQSLIDLLGYV